MPTVSRRRALALLTASCLRPSLLAQTKSTWRVASARELEAALPVRAPVEKEHIETEMRTASGIINAEGHLIAGVVMITAGYSADGKYSHYLLVDDAIDISGVALPRGRYVFGWRRDTDALRVTFYDALTGTERGSALARPMPTGVRVESFRIWPPSDRAVLQIGRFQLPYTLASSNAR